MGFRLLLADDSTTIQKVVQLTFAGEACELSVAGDGNEALSLAEQIVPDVVLADVHMPGKNGYELCAALKQHPLLKAVPVLLLAGSFEPFDEGLARAAGADGWIEKPFESQALIDRVYQLLGEAVPKAECGDEFIFEEMAGNLPTFEFIEEDAVAVVAAGAEEEDVYPLGVEDILPDEPSSLPPTLVEEAAPPAPEPLAEPAPAPALPAPVAATPVAPAPALAPSLGETDLERLVEQAVTRAVERVLAVTAERVVREVVPELAEALIREELKQIKDSVG